MGYAVIIFFVQNNAYLQFHHFVQEVNEIWYQLHVSLSKSKQLKMFNQCYFTLQGPFLQIHSHTVLIN